MEPLINLEPERIYVLILHRRTNKVKLSLYFSDEGSNLPDLTESSDVLSA
jgi:hypothetical protein